MHNNKLITILKHFNKADLNQFHKYIVSPYFNKSKQLIQFYDIILKGIHSPKTALLEKENVWKKLFKDQKYNDVRFRKLNSDLLKMIEGQQHFHQGQRQQQQQASSDDAYKILGIDESTPDKDIKRAYRKLMSQHHPDKLASKGLPEEMMNLAKEKAQDIQQAYETLRKERGFK